MVKNNKLVALNDAGRRIGETHQRAILTDRDVELMLELRAEGWGWKRLAKTFECGRRTCRDICSGSSRGQAAARWVRVNAAKPLESRP